MSEWGYFSLEELCGLSVNFLEVDGDLCFEATKAKDIERIRKHGVIESSLKLHGPYLKPSPTI